MMLNYIRADVKRILRSSSHLFLMILVFAVYFSVLYFPNRNMQVTPVSLVVSACGVLEWVMLFIGLFEMIAIFSEDFKVKTMQIAIGLGVTRTQVVLCKLFEVLALLVLDCLMVIAITMLSGAALGFTIPLKVLMDVVRVLLVHGLLGCAVFTSLTMIVLFVTHSMILSIFTYCFVGIDIVGILLSLLPMFGFEWIENLNLNRLTLSYLAGIVNTRLALGTVDIGGLVGLLIYMGIGLFATCKLFQKRELEF